jgi:hypothetical protein
MLTISNISATNQRILTKLLSNCLDSSTLSPKQYKSLKNSLVKDIDF